MAPLPLSGKRMERARRRATRVRAALERLGGEGTAREIAAETGLTPQDVGHVVRHMKIDGTVAAKIEHRNGTYAGNYRVSVWVLKEV